MLAQLITAYFTLVVLFELSIVLYVILFGLCVIVKIFGVFS